MKLIPATLVLTDVTRTVGTPTKRKWTGKMKKIAISTALSALLVAAPLAGAFAQTHIGEDRDVHFADRNNPNIPANNMAPAGNMMPSDGMMAPDSTMMAPDAMSTSSIDQGMGAESGWQVLEMQINAARTNLQPANPDAEPLDPTATARISSELDAIQQAASAEAQANGGQLSDPSYRSYSAQVRAIQDEIETL